MKNLHILQQESVDEGKLQVRIRQKNLGTPVSGASVRISFSGDPDGNIEEAGTDESGNSQITRRHYKSIPGGSNIIFS